MFPSDPAAPNMPDTPASKTERVAESNPLKLFSRLSMAVWSVLGTLTLGVAGWMGDGIVTGAIQMRDSVLRMGWFVEQIQKDVKSVKGAQAEQGRRLQRVEDALGITAPTFRDYELPSLDSPGTEDHNNRDT